MMDRKLRIKKFLKYSGLGIAILIGGILVAGQIAHYTVPIIDPPGQIYSVNSYDMHLYCLGSQNDMQPTIIIIAGGGAQSPVYYPLQEKLSETVRTCTYDRAGNGWSEPNDIPATAQNMSNELYSLLEAAKIDGPIILAGHSLGGLVSLIYTADHQEQVVGLAFIDSSHPNQFDHFGKKYSDEIYDFIDESLSSFWIHEVASKLGIWNLVMPFIDSPIPMDVQTKKMMAYFDTWAPAYSAIKSEIANIKLSFEQGREAFYDRGDLPIIAISAYDPDADFSTLPDTGLSRQEMIDTFLSFHEDLANLSTNGRHEIINGTDHFSIMYHDEASKHILSLIPIIESIYPGTKLF